ncbi:MerR family transcriptional regulator [Paracoccus sp. (in: a-proteobacteria)]|uniref:MerR family transcriptional regulator n=1 Tax=Paracoccus sp. TaxID=267 RepID=UPI0026E0C665|nr:MerR family transcriptional regulator [Paracoccus sp. (in: a-proteobacteria)]MDO5369168.1 MerR family transcriptional regulator [Paracoccus sp. (in: a-proteobacteria)]
MKSPQAFRSIGEVAGLVGVATHVLRYWETQFPALAPVRRPDGRRYYRPDDLFLAAGLCEVMREDGLTIRGARRLIERDKGAAIRQRGRQRLQGVLSPDMEDRSQHGTNGGKPHSSPQQEPSDATHPQEKGLPTTADGTGDAQDHVAMHAGWLARLNATAAVLRGGTIALPDAARDLAQALHAGRTERQS